MWAIVVAGGSGQRFGELKQFALLAGRPVAQWSVEACRPAASGVVLVVPSGSGAGTTASAAPIGSFPVAPAGLPPSAAGWPPFPTRPM